MLLDHDYLPDRPLLSKVATCAVQPFNRAEHITASTAGLATESVQGVIHCARGVKHSLFGHTWYKLPTVFQD